MRCLLRCAVAIMLVLPCAAGLEAAPREVLVMEAGADSTVIVLPADAPLVVQYAALELQYHLELITGERPPVVHEPEVPEVPVKIALGATELGKSLGFAVSDLPDWEFLVAESDGVIVLAGGDAARFEEADWNSLRYIFYNEPNGTCLAVFEFLERYCQVHWYLPSEVGMVYPQTQRLTVLMDESIQRRTDFLSTSIYPYMFNKNMFRRLQPPDEESGIHGGNYSMEISREDMLPVVEVQRWLLRNKVGGEPYSPNHSFGHWITRFGRQYPERFSYRTLENIEELFERFPDENALRNHFQLTGNPCLTAPGAFEQVMADAEDYFESLETGRPPVMPHHGSRGRFFGIVLNDNFNVCQCDDCRPLYNKPVADVRLWGSAGGSVSSYMWEFVNRAARELRRTRPDKWIGGIAYHNYMAPPADFTLEPNVGVTICTYLGNWTPALRETAHGLVRAWQDAGCRWIGMWEYYCYSAMYGKRPFFPRLAPKLLGHDVKKLHGMGVKAEFLEIEDWYGFSEEDRMAIWTNPIWLYLNVWIRFKMYDDVDRDPEQWLAEHYRLFYGPAAAPIQGFFERIEDRITDMSLRGPDTFTIERTGNPKVDWEYLFPPDVMDELTTFMQEATRLAAQEPYSTRVGWVREGFFEHVSSEQQRYLEQKALRPPTGLAQTIAYRTATPPVIDGDGSDAVWAQAPLGYLNDWRTGMEPQEETTFRLLYDDENLYLKVRCNEARVEALKAKQTARDEAVYSDDCIELHVTFDPERARAYQFLVNSIGTIQDLAYQRNEGGEMVANPAWQCAGVVAAAQVDDTGYTVELAVPLAEVGGAHAGDGTSFFANVCRERYLDTAQSEPIELQSWSPTPEGFANPMSFGQVLLSPGDGAAVFFNTDNVPNPVLYRVLKDTPDWQFTPEAITATPHRGFVRYTMDVPQDENMSGIKGAVAFTFDPPVATAEYPFIEMRFTKPAREVMLQVVYYYTAADGEKHFNWFIFSPTGEAEPGAGSFVWKAGVGGDRDKPEPVTIHNVTIYANVRGDKTPEDCTFDLYYLRIGRHTMHGDNPPLVAPTGIQ